MTKIVVSMKIVIAQEPTFIKNLDCKAKATAMKKAESQARRRATLAIVGLDAMGEGDNRSSVSDMPPDCWTPDLDNKLQEAMGELWSRLHEVLSHMSTKLADAAQPRVNKDGEENRTQIFRDSLITNAVDLCGLLTRLNVTNDPKLEKARKDLESVIAGVDPKSIRESDMVRHSVKKKVDDILSAFNF